MLQRVRDLYVMLSRREKKGLHLKNWTDSRQGLKCVCALVVGLLMSLKVQRKQTCEPVYVCVCVSRISPLLRFAKRRKNLHYIYIYKL